MSPALPGSPTWTDSTNGVAGATAAEYADHDPVTFPTTVATRATYVFDASRPLIAVPVTVDIPLLSSVHVAPLVADTCIR